MAAAEFPSPSAGDGGEQVLVVVAGTENISGSVPNAGRRRDLGQSEAPRPGQRDAVIEPAVDAVTVGQAHALAVAVLLVPRRERTAVDLGQLVVARDLDAARFDAGHRIGSQALDQRAISALPPRRGPEFPDVPI